MLLERPNLPLIRLQCGVALLCEFLRTLRVLLEQVVRLREANEALHQRAVVRYERLHALCERLHAKHAHAIRHRRRRGGIR